MAALSILRYPDPRLSQPCDAADLGDQLNQLAKAMLQTMYDAEGRGLAAPQVGEMIRLFVMDATWKEGSADPQVFVNPRITWSSDKTEMSPEGCLSIPGVVLEVPRAIRVRLAWTALDGTASEAEFEGFPAMVIQHELDHLDGIVTFDRLAPQDRDAAIRAFLP